MYISNIIKSVFTVLLTISIIGTGCSRDDSEPGTIRDASIRDGEQAIAADDPGEIESVGYDGHEVQPSEKNVLGEKLTEEANVSEGELSFEDVEIRERLTRLIAEEAYERSGWDDVGVRFFREVDGELYAVVWPNPRRVSLHARVRITSEGEIIEYRRESR